MSRAVTVCCAILVLGGPLRAQEKKTTEPGPWKFGTTVGINLSQSAFSSNWSGGDKGSFVWVLQGDITLERQFTRKFNLNNLVQLAYGQTARQVSDPNDAERNIWDAPDKSTDLILEESVGRFTLGGFVDPYLAFRLDSQFEDQSNPAGTIHFNPVKLTETGGIARVFEKTEDSEITSRLGMGFRQTFRRAFAGTGPDVESFSANDGGFEWQTTATKPILQKRVLYKGKLLVFVPVFFNQDDELEEFDGIALARNPSRERIAGFWKTPDVNLMNTFTAQVTKIISVNLYFQLVYDKFDAATNVDTSLDPEILVPSVDRGVRKAAQFKENLAIGITYRLF